MYAIIHTIEPFDATIGTTITFTWNGNQIYKVKCTIKENESGATVYTATIDTMKQQFTIPANSGLVNGTYYVAYITVFDIDNNESSLQDIGTPFYCFSTPTFTLSISENDVIKTSVYQVSLTYSQAQNELLDSYQIILYSYGKTILQDSGTNYNTDDMGYVISSLENATQYYIRALGVTVHGMSIDTGYILFSVSYTQAQVFSTLELNNLENIGAIEYKSNIVSALGVAEKDVTYIDGTQVDLRNNSLTFDTGFEVSGNFTSIFVFNNPSINKPLIDFPDENLKVLYRKGSYNDSNGEKVYFELRVDMDGLVYTLQSNYVTEANENQQYSLLLNRENNFYDIKVVVVAKEEVT